MRIAELKLEAYGPFSRVTLPLGPAPLTIVVGPNEAGKSTTLRAITALLYGFPHRAEESDAFRHPTTSLRVGATLLDESGGRHMFVRRKGTKDTLRDARGEPVDEEKLTRLLSVDRERFLSQFGLDHVRLRAGGEALLASGGGLGESLFAARAGITSVRAVQAALQAEAEAIFKPRGSKARIPSALATYKTLVDEAAAHAMTTREWEETSKALETVRRECTELTARRDERRAARSVLQRTLDALPLALQRNALRSRLDAMKDVLLLPADYDPQERIEAMRTLREGAVEITGREEALERRRERLAGLAGSPAMLEEHQRVSDLREEYGAVRKAAQDAPNLRARRNVLRDAARDLLRGIDPDRRLEDAQSLRITEVQKAGIRALAGEHQEIVSETRALERQLQDLADETAEVGHELERLGPARNMTALRSALDELREQGALDRQIATARAALDDQRAKARLQFARMHPWAGTPEALIAARLPGRESVEVFEQELARLDDQLCRLEERREEARSRVTTVIGRLEAQEHGGAVPSEEELEMARERRDRRWALVKSAWLGGAAPEDVDGFAGSEPLEAAFEDAMQAADELADRLRREAGRVEKKAQLLAERRACEEDLLSLEDAVGEARRAREAAGNRWTSLWGQCGLAPLTPREMAGWLQRAEQLREASVDVGRLERELSQLEQAQARARGRLLEVTQAAAISLPDSASLSPLLAAAERECRDAEMSAQRAQKLAADLARRDARRQRLEDTRRGLQGRLGDWQARWRASVAPLGMGDQAGPEEVAAVLDRLDKLFGTLAQERETQLRIDSIARDAAAFEQRLARAVEDIAPDLAGSPADHAVRELAGRMEQAQKQDGERRTLEESVRTEEEALEALRRRVARAGVALAELCRQAGGAAPQELEGIETRSSSRRQLQKEFATIEEQLAAFAGGRALEAFARDVAARDADQTREQLELLEGEIQDLEEKLSAVNQQIGALQNRLEAADGGDRAAAAMERARFQLGTVEADSAEYVRLRVAAALLQREMTRLGETSQGPVLAAASRSFASLTGGSFVKLRTDMGSDGRPALLGVRADGSDLGVRGMSEGTCDQLYLALRLAFLEHHVTTTRPMPLILDDVLVHFDDMRAAAALGALADLAQKTQVVFFTHHEHLVEVAGRALDEAAFSVVRLGSPQEVRALAS